MRILHLLASPTLSGPAENVTWLALAQRALGHEVSVAVDRKRTDGTSEEPLAPRLAALGLLDEGGLELSVKSTPWAVLMDLQRMRRRREQVLHAHFSHDHLLARWGRPRGARVVRSVHAPRSLRRSLPFAHAFTVPCVGDLAKLGGRPAGVLPALVDPAFVPPRDVASLRAQLGLEGGPLIGMVSTFQASRRHALALEAFVQVMQVRPQARLVLVGDGVLLPQVRARAGRLGLLESVTFAGYRSGPDFVAWLQALDEVWILGLGNDWSGRAAAQAQACGVRVTAVDEGALPTFADAVVPPTADAVAAASLQGTRRAASRPSNEDIARSVLRLYGSSGDGA